MLTLHSVSIQQNNNNIILLYDTESRCIYLVSTIVHDVTEVLSHIEISREGKTSEFSWKTCWHVKIERVYIVYVIFIHMFLCPHCSPSGEGENFRPNIRYVFYTALGADCKLQCNNIYNRKLIVYDCL